MSSIQGSEREREVRSMSTEPGQVKALIFSHTQVKLICFTPDLMTDAPRRLLCLNHCPRSAALPADFLTNKSLSFQVTVERGHMQLFELEGHGESETLVPDWMLATQVADGAALDMLILLLGQEGLALLVGRVQGNNHVWVLFHCECAWGGGNGEGGEGKKTEPRPEK